MKIYHRILCAVLLGGIVLNVCFAQDNKSVMSEAYWEIWNNDVQAKIDNDIDRNRKAEAVLRFNGLPSDVSVNIEQLTHDFHFGANIFNFNQLGNKSRNDKYKDLFGTLFNQASVAFYWKVFETEPGRLRFHQEYWDTEEYWNEVESPKEQPHWRRPATDPVITFLEKKEVRIKGHPMIWGNNTWQKPEWLYTNFCPENEKESIEALGGIESFGKLSVDQMRSMAPEFAKILKDQYRKRITRLIDYYGSRIHCWDIVNESVRGFHGNIITGNDYQNNEVYGYMPGDYTYEGFRVANEYFPEDVKININDHISVESKSAKGSAQNYLDQILALKAQGLRIDLVGSQMHLFNPKVIYEIAGGASNINGGVSDVDAIDPVTIQNMVDILSKAEIPISISEVSITAGDGDRRGQLIQAEITKNLFRMWFSIKEVEEITWWNIVDDAGAPGEPSTSGLFTRNMEPKPAYFVLNDLINKEWKTKKIANVDSDGIVRFRGFKGKYQVSWKNNSGEIEKAEFYLSESGNSIMLN